MQASSEVTVVVYVYVLYVVNNRNPLGYHFLAST